MRYTNVYYIERRRRGATSEALTWKSRSLAC